MKIQARRRHWVAVGSLGLLLVVIALVRESGDSWTAGSERRWRPADHLQNSMAGFAATASYRPIEAGTVPDRALRDETR